MQTIVEHSERLNMRVAPELVRAIDDWRRLQPLIVSRSEAIRILINKGIESQRVSKSK